MSDERYSISQVARRFGVRVSTLRYYDELGLLTPAGRRGNVRFYGRAELARLALIRRLHHGGLVSLADTTALLDDTAAAERPDGRDVLTASVDAIKRQVEELTAAQRLLEHLLTCPRADPIRDCPYLRAELDQAVDTAMAERDQRDYQGSGSSATSSSGADSRHAS
ncbi:MerR family transcriptional regulator [Amycolatopsis nigrescens]|uniref:MerR family transcriptional regulator n=1 Tax=Amycolatopsis nigrescens TaxID=381445 RepID=UPI00036E2763|nr:MerR family transcriptional regulator [Amycolatopsis nigrescens]